MPFYVDPALQCGEPRHIEAVLCVPNDETLASAPGPSGGREGEPQKGGNGHEGDLTFSMVYYIYCRVFVGSIL